MNRAQYHAYLASPAWAERRDGIRYRSRGICERCGAARMSDVHHLTYARVGHERDSDLQAVCRRCHAVLHADPWGWVKLLLAAGLAAYLMWEFLWGT